MDFSSGRIGSQIGAYKTPESFHSHLPYRLRPIVSNRTTPAFAWGRSPLANHEREFPSDRIGRRVKTALRKNSTKCLIGAGFRISGFWSPSVALATASGGRRTAQSVAEDGRSFDQGRLRRLWTMPNPAENSSFYERLEALTELRAPFEWHGCWLS